MAPPPLSTFLLGANNLTPSNQTDKYSLALYTRTALKVPLLTTPLIYHDNKPIVLRLLTHLYQRKIFFTLWAVPINLRGKVLPPAAWQGPIYAAFTMLHPSACIR